MKKALERTIYDENDNLYSEGSWNDAIEYLCDCEGMEVDEITDDDVWNVLYDWDENTWFEEKENLKKFFDENGDYGYICSADGYNEFTFYDFDDLYNSIIFKLADYGNLKIWDENGHFYISTSLNDCWEIKELTKAGHNLYDDWCYYNYGEDKSEKQIFSMIMNCNLYSKLPHFANRVYGCKKYEYEKKGEKTA